MTQKLLKLWMCYMYLITSQLVYFSNIWIKQKKVLMAHIYHTLQEGDKGNHLQYIQEKGK